MGRPAQLNPNRARIAEQQARALAMKSAGRTYQQIAAELGVGVATAYKRVTDACAEHVVPEVEHLRTVESARLEHLLAALADGVEAGDVKAIAEARRISESLRKLFGADVTKPLEIAFEHRSDVESDIACEAILAALKGVLAVIDADAVWRRELTRYALDLAQHTVDRMGGSDPGPLPEAPKQRLAITAGPDPVERPHTEPPEPPRPVVPRIEREDTPERTVQRAFDRLPPELGGRGPAWQRTIAAQPDPRQNIAGG